MSDALAPLTQAIENLDTSDTHGNRAFNKPELARALLLSFFNPVMRTLRELEDASEIGQNRDWIGAEAKKSTVSDAMGALDPSVLLPVLEDLVSRMPAIAPQDREMAALARKIIAVDGSFFNLAKDVAWAVSHRPRGKRSAKVARLNLMLDCASGTPEGVSVSGSGESEADALRSRVVADAVYICDRGFYSHKLIAAILEAGSDFVLRIRSDSRFEAKEERKMDPEAPDADWKVVSDRIGRLEQWHGEGESPELREVVVEFTNREGVVTRARLLTTLLDAKADVVAMLYRRRWQVELFFRWLKVHANFRHLMSHDKNGVQWQFYIGVMAVLAMCVKSGRKPGKHTLLALHWASRGADLEERLEKAKYWEDRQRRDAQLRKERERKRNEAKQGKKAATKAKKA